MWLVKLWQVYGYTEDMGPAGPAAIINTEYTQVFQTVHCIIWIDQVFQILHGKVLTR